MWLNYNNGRGKWRNNGKFDAQSRQFDFYFCQSKSIFVFFYFFRLPCYPWFQRLIWHIFLFTDVFYLYSYSYSLHMHITREHYSTQSLFPSCSCSSDSHVTHDSCDRYHLFFCPQTYFIHNHIIIPFIVNSLVNTNLRYSFSSLHSSHNTKQIPSTDMFASYSYHHSIHTEFTRGH